VKARGNSGQGRNTSAVKNCCAASTKAAASSRDYHKKARCCSAAEVHRSARRSNCSGDCRCSSAWMGRCYFRAGRRCRPRADDRS